VTRACPVLDGEAGHRLPQQPAESEIQHELYVLRCAKGRIEWPPHAPRGMDAHNPPALYPPTRGALLYPCIGHRAGQAGAWRALRALRVSVPHVCNGSNAPVARVTAQCAAPLRGAHRSAAHRCSMCTSLPGNAAGPGAALGARAPSWTA